MRKWSAAALALLLSFVVSALVLAQGQAPPPGWGKPKALPPANGQGQVTFQHGGTPVTLPLQEIEIQTHSSGMYMVTVKYVDPRQENELTLSFSSMPKLGARDPKLINGFLVKTKAHGTSKSSAGKSTCTLAIATLTTKEVSGTLTCSGMTDLSGWANDEAAKCDVFFLWPDVDSPAILERIPHDPAIDDLRYTPGAVIRRVARKDAPKSKLTRMVGTPLYQRLTIRNCNTARKLLALMEEDGPAEPAFNRRRRR